MNSSQYKPDDWQIDLEHNNFCMKEIFNHILKYSKNPTESKKEKVTLLSNRKLKVNLKLNSTKVFNSKKYEEYLNDSERILLKKNFCFLCRDLFIKFYRITLLTPLTSNHKFIIFKNIENYSNLLKRQFNYFNFLNWLNQIFLEPPLEDKNFFVTSARVKNGLYLIVRVLKELKQRFITKTHSKTFLQSFWLCL